MEEYLKQLIHFYPVSSNQQNVKTLLLYVIAHAKSKGLHTALLKYNDTYNAYISTRKSKQSRLLLQAHVDVVPAHDQPYAQEGDKIFGRGCYDMLFATACYLKLLDDVAEKIPQLDFAIMLSGDEELGGFNGVKQFLLDGYSTNICILPDAGNRYGGLNVAAKGIYNCTVRIHGRSHHGSRPWEGDGAASKLVHFLSELELVFDASSQENSTLTIAKLEAGMADNQGPAFADAILDIRYSDKSDLIRITNALNQLLSKYNGEIILLVEGSDYQLVTTHPDVDTFVKLYEKQVGVAIEFTKAHGSSDARFFSERNIPVIMLRPNGGGAHGDLEWISKSSINDFCQLLKDYVLKVATSK